MVRPWLVIPVLGLASGGVALGAHHSIASACAIALLGAALAAAIRAFNGPTLAAAVSAGAGAALGVLGLLAVGATSLRPALGGAVAMFAICELARAKPPNASPLPAAFAAIAAGVLDPAYVALIPVAGVHLVVSPWPHRPWMIALPITGVLATGFVIAMAISHAGHADSARVTLARIGELLGPLAACAALAGIAICATRARFAAAAVYGVVALTLVVAFTATAGKPLGPAVPLVAALASGIAIGRLAAMIRMPVGQAFLGATAGFVLVVVPAWSLVASL